MMDEVRDSGFTLYATERGLTPGSWEWESAEADWKAGYEAGKATQ